MLRNLNCLGMMSNCLVVFMGSIKCFNAINLFYIMFIDCKFKCYNSFYTVLSLLISIKVSCHSMLRPQSGCTNHKIATETFKNILQDGFTLQHYWFHARVKSQPKLVSYHSPRNSLNIAIKDDCQNPINMTFEQILIIRKYSKQQSSMSSLFQCFLPKRCGKNPDLHDLSVPVLALWTSVNEQIETQRNTN